MADISNDIGMAFRGSGLQVENQGPALDEFYWGYVIRSKAVPTVGTFATQLLSLIFGAGLLAFAFTLMFQGQIGFMSTNPTIHTLTIGLVVCLGAFLLRDGSRGTAREFHVDTSLGEIRIVSRNRAGRCTLIGRYGFDSIGGVFLDRTEQPEGQAVLTLRYRDTSQVVPLLVGSITHLTPISSRIYDSLMAEVVAQSDDADDYALAS